MLAAVLSHLVIIIHFLSTLANATPEGHHTFIDIRTSAAVDTTVIVAGVTYTVTTGDAAAVFDTAVVASCNSSIAADDCRSKQTGISMATVLDIGGTPAFLAHRAGCFALCNNREHVVSFRVLGPAPLLDTDAAVGDSIDLGVPLMLGSHLSQLDVLPQYVSVSRSASCNGVQEYLSPLRSSESGLGVERPFVPTWGGQHTVCFKYESQSFFVAAARIRVCGVTAIDGISGAMVLPTVGFSFSLSVECPTASPSRLSLVHSRDDPGSVRLPKEGCIAEGYEVKLTSRAKRSGDQFVVDANIPEVSTGHFLLCVSLPDLGFSQLLTDAGFTVQSPVGIQSEGDDASSDPNVMLPSQLERLVIIMEPPATDSDSPSHLVLILMGERSTLQLKVTRTAGSLQVPVSSIMDAATPDVFQCLMSSSKAAGEAAAFSLGKTITVRGPRSASHPRQIQLGEEFTVVLFGVALDSKADRLELRRDGKNVGSINIGTWDGDRLEATATATEGFGAVTLVYTTDVANATQMAREYTVGEVEVQKDYSLVINSTVVDFSVPIKVCVSVSVGGEVLLMLKHTSEPKINIQVTLKRIRRKPGRRCGTFVALFGGQYEARLLGVGSPEDVIGSIRLAGPVPVSPQTPATQPVYSTTAQAPVVKVLSKDATQLPPLRVHIATHDPSECPATLQTKCCSRGEGCTLTGVIEGSTVGADECELVVKDVSCVRGEVHALLKGGALDVPLFKTVMVPMRFDVSWEGELANGDILGGSRVSGVAPTADDGVQLFFATGTACDHRDFRLTDPIAAGKTRQGAASFELVVPPPYYSHVNGSLYFHSNTYALCAQLPLGGTGVVVVATANVVGFAVESRVVDLGGGLRSRRASALLESSDYGSLTSFAVGFDAAELRKSHEVFLTAQEKTCDSNAPGLSLGAFVGEPHMRTLPAKRIHRGSVVAIHLPLDSVELSRSREPLQLAVCHRATRTAMWSKTIMPLTLSKKVTLTTDASKGMPSRRVLFTGIGDVIRIKREQCSVKRLQGLIFTSPLPFIRLQDFGCAASSADQELFNIFQNTDDDLRVSEVPLETKRGGTLVVCVFHGNSHISRMVVDIVGPTRIEADPIQRTAFITDNRGVVSSAAFLPVGGRRGCDASGVRYTKGFQPSADQPLAFPMSSQGIPQNAREVLLCLRMNMSLAYSFATNEFNGDVRGTFRQLPVAVPISVTKILMDDSGMDYFIWPDNIPAAATSFRSMANTTLSTKDLAGQISLRVVHVPPHRIAVLSRPDRLHRLCAHSVSSPSAVTPKRMDSWFLSRLVDFAKAQQLPIPISTRGGVGFLASVSQPGPHALCVDRDMGPLGISSGFAGSLKPYGPLETVSDGLDVRDVRVQRHTIDSCKWKKFEVDIVENTPADLLLRGLYFAALNSDDVFSCDTKAAKVTFQRPPFWEERERLIDGRKETRNVVTFNVSFTHSGYFVMCFRRPNKSLLVGEDGKTLRALQRFTKQLGVSARVPDQRRGFVVSATDPAGAVLVKVASPTLKAIHQDRLWAEVDAGGRTVRRFHVLIVSTTDRCAVRGFVVYNEDGVVHTENLWYTRDPAGFLVRVPTRDRIDGSDDVANERLFVGALVADPSVPFAAPLNVWEVPQPPRASPPSASATSPPAETGTKLPSGAAIVDDFSDDFVDDIEDVESPQQKAAPAPTEASTSMLAVVALLACGGAAVFAWFLWSSKRSAATSEDDGIPIVPFDALALGSHGKAAFGSQPPRNTARYFSGSMTVQVSVAYGKQRIPTSLLKRDVLILRFADNSARGRMLQLSTAFRRAQTRSLANLHKPGAREATALYVPIAHTRDPDALIFPVGAEATYGGWLADQLRLPMERRAVVPCFEPEEVINFVYSTCMVEMELNASNKTFHITPEALWVSATHDFLSSSTDRNTVSQHDRAPRLCLAPACYADTSSGSPEHFTRRLGTMLLWLTRSWVYFEELRHKARGGRSSQNSTPSEDSVVRMFDKCVLEQDSVVTFADSDAGRALGALIDGCIDGNVESPSDVLDALRDVL